MEPKHFDDRQVMDAWELAQELIEEHQQRDRKYKDLDRLYFNEYQDLADHPDHSDPLGTVAIGTDAEQVDLGQRKAAAELDLGVNLISSLEPVVVVPATSPAPADINAADEREAWLNAYLTQAETEDRRGIIRAMAWHGFHRDIVALRVVARIDRLHERGQAEEMDTTRLPSETAGGYEQGERLPVQIQVRDPAKVYPYFTEDGLTAVVEQYQRSVREIRAEHGEDAIPVDRDGRLADKDEIEWTEYWSEDLVIYWAGGRLVAKKKNELGQVPYTVRYPVQAQSDDPGRQIRPFLQDALGLAKRINRLLSIQETTAVRYNNDALIITGEVFTGSARDPGLSLEPMAINYAEPDTKIQWLHRSGAVPETQQLLQLYLQEWQRMTWPAEMHGLEHVARSGLAWGLMTEAGRVRMVPVLSAMEQALGDAVSMVLRWMEVVVGPLVGYKVSVSVLKQQEMQGRQIQVEEQAELDTQSIDGQYHVDVKLGIPASAEQLQKSLLADRLVGSGLMSRQTAAEEYLGVQNWAEERQRLQRELASQDPQVQALQAALAKVEAIRELKEKLEEMDLTPDELALLPPELVPPELQQPAAPQPGIPPAMPPPMEEDLAGPGQGLPPELGGDWGGLGMAEQGIGMEEPDLMELMGGPLTGYPGLGG